MIHKSILIIEDEESIQLVIKLALEMETSWKTIVASSGKEGIDLAAKELPDAILLDMIMPQMNGLTTFKKLQANPVTESIPVILLTAQTLDIEPQQLYSLGIREVIPKPFDPLTLGSTIAQILAW